MIAFPLVHELGEAFDLVDEAKDDDRVNEQNCYVDENEPNS